VAPTPPSAPGLPVTGSGPEPMLAGGVGLFATLSGLGWAIRRRR
jgi:LPXTG-motif cell wall-anchored protein